MSPLLPRPSRPTASKVAHIEGQENYNIWYGKFMGDFKKMGKGGRLLGPVARRAFLAALPAARSV